MKQPVCTVSSLAADEPLIGSAPHAPAWVCLEQEGPWGARAFTESHLDPALGARIERLAADTGVRPALVRRPGRHADDHRAAHPIVLIAHTAPTDPWLLVGRLDSSARLLDLDWAALADGVRPTWDELEEVFDEQLLVCTNGTRDTCCARFGRPVVLAAAQTHPDRVWEVTHTSGHRFAPTSVLLPSGNLHGRLTLDDATGLLAASDAGLLVLDGWRGRSSWPGAGQAAEEQVRREHAVTGLHDLNVSPDGASWRVDHLDGRSWSVDVDTVEAGVRAESCGKELKPVQRFVATFG